MLVSSPPRFVKHLSLLAVAAAIIAGFAPAAASSPLERSTLMGGAAAPERASGAALPLQASNAQAECLSANRFAIGPYEEFTQEREITAPFTMSASATWEPGPESLALIVSGPSQAEQTARADGPSGVAVHYPITPADVAAGRTWTIRVYNADPRAAAGCLHVALSDQAAQAGAPSTAPSGRARLVVTSKQCLPLRIRPSTSSESLACLATGEQASLADGPIEASGAFWWGLQSTKAAGYADQGALEAQTTFFVNRPG